MKTLADISTEQNGELQFNQTKSTAVEFIKICKREYLSAGETVKLLFKNFTGLNTETLVHLIRHYYK